MVYFVIISALPWIVVFFLMLFPWSASYGLSFSWPWAAEYLCQDTGTILPFSIYPHHYHSFCQHFCPQLARCCAFSNVLATRNQCIPVCVILPDWASGERPCLLPFSVSYAHTNSSTTLQLKLAASFPGSEP